MVKHGARPRWKVRALWAASHATTQGDSRSEIWPARAASAVIECSDDGASESICIPSKGALEPPRVQPRLASFFHRVRGSSVASSRDCSAQPADVATERLLRGSLT